jgi:DNA-binding transcriptional MerR regulator
VHPTSAHKLPGGFSWSAGLGEAKSADATTAGRRSDHERKAFKGDALFIGKVAALFGLTTRAIRYYEQEGLVQPARDDANRRVFDQRARACLQVIALLRSGSVPLEDVRRVVTGFEGRREVASAAAEMLKRRSVALEAELDRVRRAQARLVELPKL